MDLRQSQEIINVNKIFFEDSFIDLINKLSKTINTYNHQSIFLISKTSNLFNKFESNIQKIVLINEQNIYNYNINNKQRISKVINDINLIIKEFKSMISIAEENLKIFFENAKNIFKEMKNKKNNSLEEIYNDYISHNSPKNNNQKNEKNKNSNYKAKIISYSQNQIKERNIINNKRSLYNSNIKLMNYVNIKKLISNMSYYNNIIANNSPKEKENYINLQKQLLFEINKSINLNQSKNDRIRNRIKNKIIAEFSNNDIIRNNKSYTTNKFNNEIYLTKAINNNFSNNNRASSNSNLITNNSNDLKIEINNLKSQLITSKFNYKTLEKKLEESNNNIDFLKKNEKNLLNKLKINLGNKMRSLECENIELKKKYELLLQKENIKEANKKEIRENYEENNLDLELKLDENEIIKLKKDIKNKKNEYDLNIKKLNENILYLSKNLEDKNGEIKVLQNYKKIYMNELNKLKLKTKNNENQLKIKFNEDQKKSYSPDKRNDKEILSSNSTKVHNLSERSHYKINNNDMVSILESEISKLKSELKKGKEEKDNLLLKLNILEKDISDKNNKNELLENELKFKNNKVEEDNKLIGELKSEKHKYIQKIKEYRNIENLNLSQIKILKSQIKEMERQQNVEIENTKNKKDISKKEFKKRINELEIENLNIKRQLTIELDYNNKLKNEVKFKTEQTEKLNKEIYKLIEEKESNKLKEKSFNDKNNENYNIEKIIRSKTNEKYHKNNIINISEREMNINNIFNTGDNFPNNNDKNKNNQQFLLTDIKTKKTIENDDDNNEEDSNIIDK